MILWIIVNTLRHIFFGIGTYLQVKIIRVCQKEKDKTWLIDITRSVVMIPLCFFNALFEPINDYFPSYPEYTGVSACYVSASIYILLPNIVAFHSLLISVMKYLWIVHPEKMRIIGDEKFTKWSFWFNLMHALLLTIPTIFLFDFESSHSLVHCFGLEEEIAQRYNSSSAKVERMFMCKLRSGNHADGEAGISYVLIQSFCGIKMVYTTFVMSNIWEGIFYYMIFKKMKSQVTPSQNNYAVKCLNRDVQLRNIRKVKVNANIAFVIWILEWIANASIYLCWILAPEVTILMAIMWYYIFLPHIFLMNTSHNKDLIIDDGLKTTILNACKLPFNFSSNNASPVEEIENGANSTQSPKLNPNNLNDRNRMVFRQTNGVFTITKSPIISKRYAFSLPNTPEPIPSSRQANEIDD